MIDQLTDDEMDFIASCLLWMHRVNQPEGPFLRVWTVEQDAKAKRIVEKLVKMETGKEMEKK